MWGREEKDDDEEVNSLRNTQFLRVLRNENKWE